MINEKLPKLREMAQAVGVKLTFGMTKAQIVAAIEEKMAADLEESKPVVMKPNDELKQRIETLLADFHGRGLRVGVDGETWILERAGKQDSGHSSAPDFVILNAAKGCM